MADALRARRRGALTFEIVKSLIASCVVVSGQDIIQAMRLLAERTKQVVEPGGATALAAAMKSLIPGARPVAATRAGDPPGDDPFAAPPRPAQPRSRRPRSSWRGFVAGEPMEQMAITAVSLVVASVPESLPAVVTIALALGAFGWRVATPSPTGCTARSASRLKYDGTPTDGRIAVEQAVTAGW